ncbi:MAG TPA: glutamyl-tRNA reductase [Steroidobacteraceae bacterium]|nr:glutamyl-tRNA reductase [Steroidobacteraceae bacterium]
MPFIVVGINHRTAPVELREKVVFAEPELPAALDELRQLPQVRESVIVSTCNRTELYCYADVEDPVAASHTASPANIPATIIDWLAQWHEINASDIHGCVYQHHDTTAIRHAFAVASGMDSMMLGEAQILGQLKDAYRAAQQTHSTGPYLHRLFQAAFSAAKRVRTETRIGASAVSVASAAVSMARTVFEKLEERTALLLGAGETIALAARHLHASGVRRMIVCNRTLERAQALAEEFDGFAITLDRLDTHLPEADIIISSTASPAPLITHDAVKQALKARRHKPMFMADIAVPRDIEPEVAKLSDVYLFTIDHLQTVVSDNLAARQQAAVSAEQLLDEEVHVFEQHLRTLDAVPTIRQLRDDAEALKTQTIEQARRMLNNGRPAQEVLEFLADTLTHRLIHSPSQRLRQAGEQGEADLIRAAQELFALSNSSRS